MYDIDIPIITLDGPSGTGKGTICHLLAKHLKWNVLDSGVIYRVLAYAANIQNIALNDSTHLASLALDLDLYFEPDEAGSRVMLRDKDISELIRTEQCGQDASQIAVIPEVRQALLERQRAFAQPPGLVTDGRDMGTVVFPHAFLKIYLFANEEERANRRFLQLKEKGNDVSLAQVIEELSKRDARDTARTHSPLKPAEDSIKIDTSDMSIIQIFHFILKLLDERWKNL